MVKPIKCPDCESWFCGKKDLLEHQKIHKRKPRSCQYCHMVYARGDDLARHEQTHADAGEKAFKCLKCDSSFNWLSQLKIHGRTHDAEKSGEMIHTGEKFFECQSCQSCFLNDVDLEVHERIHTGERPFQCQHCYSSFRSQIYLMNHENHHVGEKPFASENCELRFYEETKLVEHKEMHTGKENPSAPQTENPSSLTSKKPFECRCGLRFDDKTQWVEHDRVHTGGVKPYACQLCELRFYEKAQLENHEIKIHNKTKLDVKKPWLDDPAFKALVKERRCLYLRKLRKQLSEGEGEKLAEVSREVDRTRRRLKRAHFDPPKSKEKLTRESTAANDDERIDGKNQIEMPEGESIVNRSKNDRPTIDSMPIQCPPCDSRIDKPDALVAHQRTHVGKESYRCRYCDSHFLHLQSLKEHEPTHAEYETAMKGEINEVEFSLEDEEGERESSSF